MLLPRGTARENEYCMFFGCMSEVGEKLAPCAMKPTRYCRPSMTQLLGITRAKRRVRHSLGISLVEA